MKAVCVTFVSRNLVTNVDLCFAQDKETSVFFGFASLFNSCNLNFSFCFQNPPTYGQYQAHRPDHYAGGVDANYNRSYMQALDHSRAYASSPQYGGAVKGPYHEQHNHAGFEDGVWVGFIFLSICKINQ